eukprot:CAMPEP_0172312046 /NCGR_PEP_ID=MMETSP1058-20130122/16472_1 /TAXON_ID=83371 /ORGANISM="Detonula confervacea, Strain CCMP 353" /LENGTH=245 /DNA_ID=CAMNT_0013025391 /DNA_START=118 /DNA_END=855 /DNA_ORIENTATION=-
MNMHPPVTFQFQDVLENVGMNIYYYLHPKDLFSFGSCSRQLWNDIIHNKLAKICMHHLPLHLGVGTNYLAEFCKGHSFSDKAELLEYVLDKTEAAKLMIVDTNTMEESRSRAREVLLGDDNKSTAKFYAPNRNDSNNLLSHPLQCTVECHYQNVIEKCSAMSWVKYILDRDAFKKNRKDKDTCQFIKAWLDFLFSQRNIDFGMWRWSCKHGNLNGHGIAGVGVMLITVDSEGINNTMEIRLARKY